MWRRVDLVKLKRSDFRPATEWIDALPAERRERAQAGAALILEDMHLAEIRKAVSRPQTLVAEQSGLSQGEVSRIETNPESVQLRTLSRYVEGLGGSMKVVVDFPDGTRAEMPIRAGRPVEAELGTPSSRRRPSTKR